jgi:hypothetical protein
MHGQKHAARWISSVPEKIASLVMARMVMARMGRHRAFAAHVDFGPKRDTRTDLTCRGRRAAWPVVYPGPGVRHD